MLTFLRRYLSYLIPLTRTTTSAINGPLEVTWYRGRKLLDTRHANYSYGSLQRVLRYGLLFVAPETARQLLLLGLGGGSVVETLRKEHPAAGHLTAIELDPTIIQLAATEFNIQPGPDLAIVCADAFAWVRTAPAASFDLIIIDLFIDLDLPAGLRTEDFWQQVWRLLTPGGRVLANTLTAAHLSIQGQELAEFLPQLGFRVKEVEVELLNRLLILEKPLA
ncbi:spermidine synthase [Hymenobacter yonginensis]|uniref:Fused MFS/spermidine synthase n=1 Tax=Hymenobacter yonginensis TaxID=748197 RepID=A0ABY7PLK0_9BACT|nr:fused MFS/spermidine synthase [Hymenobacter yonginensis]WBO83566.1 fused MFS/spermidine synthase [Hymenobacter yonginensis]